MTSLILRATVRIILPLLLLFSIFLLIRGHNEPGGGFAAGLVAASAFALYSIAYGTTAARELLRLEPRSLLSIGLAIALISGWVSLFRGLPFLTGMWGYLPLPGMGKTEVGTPVLFDIGVFLVVIGATTMILFELEEVE